MLPAKFNLKWGGASNPHTVEDSFTEAAIYGHIDLVKLYVDTGMNVNALDRERNSALYCSAFKGHEEVIKFLLEKDADVDYMVPNGPGYNAELMLKFRYPNRFQKIREEIQEKSRLADYNHYFEKVKLLAHACQIGGCSTFSPMRLKFEREGGQFPIMAKEMAKNSREFFKRFPDAVSQDVQNMLLTALENHADSLLCTDQALTASCSLKEPTLINSGYFTHYNCLLKIDDLLMLFDRSGGGKPSSIIVYRTSKKLFEDDRFISDLRQIVFRENSEEKDFHEIIVNKLKERKYIFFEDETELLTLLLDQSSYRANICTWGNLECFVSALFSYSELKNKGLSRPNKKNFVQCQEIVKKQDIVFQNWQNFQQQCCLQEYLDIIEKQPSLFEYDLVQEALASMQECRCLFPELKETLRELETKANQFGNFRDRIGYKVAKFGALIYSLFE